MMKYKAGDKVRVSSKDWLNTQEGVTSEAIYGPDGNFMITKMQELEGRVFTISSVDDSRGRYALKGLPWIWSAWMFDPEYVPEKHPLSFDAAVETLLAGDILYDAEGNICHKDEDGCRFVRVVPKKDGPQLEDIYKFDELYATRPVSERIMTQWEALDWASSERSLGWVVRLGKAGWGPPQQYSYDADIERYERARLTADLSGIDDKTIQRLEVEER
jgi:hypothetical protein